MSSPQTGWFSDTDHEATLTGSVTGAQPLRSLLRLMRPHRRGWAIAVVAFVVKDSPVWVMPPVVAAIIDIVVAGGPLQRIWLWAGIAAVLLVLNYPFSMIVVRLTSAATRSLAYSVRSGLAARMQRLSLGFHNRQSASIVQTKIVRDVENLELMLGQLFPTIVSATATLIGALVVTAWQVPQFVVVFAFAIPLAASLIIVIRRRAVSRNEAFRREVEELSAQVGEMAALLPLTRGHALEDVATARVAERADSVRRAGSDLDVLNGRFGAVSWISYQLLGLVCLVGAAAASITGVIPITPGQVVLVSTYFSLLTNAIVMLLGAAPTFARGMDAMRSIADVADELDVEDNTGKTRLDHVTGDIALRDLTVRYPDAEDEPPALDSVTLDIRAGETVAFVGASGSGKSTILNVILGFVRPTGGAVLIDGQDLATLHLRALRRHVSIVPQETVLLAGTVRQNVTYGAGDVPDEVVLEALAAANALDIVQGAQGLDTTVGERGSRLSGGQRQRLAIARALVRDPRILVLDEATSALDPRSEATVTEALDRARRGRTTLIVAHRLSTVRRADRIVVIDRGRVVEQGTHEELLEADGAYSRLVLLQAG